VYISFSQVEKEEIEKAAGFSLFHELKPNSTRLINRAENKNYGIPDNKNDTENEVNDLASNVKKNLKI
jgi:hypothetical protein